jgi:hypothetical protein
MFFNNFFKLQNYFLGFTQHIKSFSCSFIGCKVSWLRNILTRIHFFGGGNYINNFIFMFYHLRYYPLKLLKGLLYSILPLTKLSALRGIYWLYTFNLYFLSCLSFKGIYLYNTYFLLVYNYFVLSLSCINSKSLIYGTDFNINISNKF